MQLKSEPFRLVTVDAAVNADAIRHGEGGGGKRKNENPTRNGTLERPMDTDWQRGYFLPGSLSLVIVDVHDIIHAVSSRETAM